MAGTAVEYNAEGVYDVRVHELTYRRDGDGSWPARIYHPEGDGPFPALLDVHGGAWTRGKHIDNQRIDRALAASGLVVAAIGCRQAPNYPYPAQVADVNYATRWLKAHGRDWNADVRSLGGLGTSSGGHSMTLSAMRPHHPRYRTFTLSEAPDVPATVSYILAGWPVLDPYARYLFAREQGRAPLVDASEAYFGTPEAMREGNPQLALERGERVELPPMLILQGAADDNVPLSVSQRFVEAYRAAGGAVELELFPGMPHGFARDPGAESDRALGIMKAFVARQLAAATPRCRIWVDHLAATLRSRGSLPAGSWAGPWRPPGSRRAGLQRKRASARPSPRALPTLRQVSGGRAAAPLGLSPGLCVPVARYAYLSQRTVKPRCDGNEPWPLSPQPGRGPAEYLRCKVPKPPPPSPAGRTHRPLRDPQHPGQRPRRVPGRPRPVAPLIAGPGPRSPDRDRAPRIPLLTGARGVPNLLANRIVGAGGSGRRKATKAATSP